MSAQFVDALKGYEFFLDSRGEKIREEINDYLLGIGRAPISIRTYGHFNKLRSHGFEGYIPINKFDVFQSLGRIQMVADRRRYVREKIEVRCKISRDARKWTDALIIDRSLVGFGLMTVKRFPISRGSQMLVRITNYQDIPTILVWRKHEADHTRMGLRALEFIAKYRLDEEEISKERLTGLLSISRFLERDLHWNEVYRILVKVDELLDASSSLIYAVADYSGVEVRLARPIVSKIHYGSPGETQIKVDFGIADIVKTIIEKIQFWGLEKKRYRGEVRHQELENANLEIEVMRNAINLKREAVEDGLLEDITTELMEPMRRVLRVDQLPPGTLSPESLEAGILKDRLLPAATELVAGDDPDFEVEVNNPSG